MQKEVTLIVRQATLADVPSIVRVHERAFVGFFLTQLGPRFLSRLYQGFLADADGVLIVAEASGETIVGLLAGSRKPEGFFRKMRRRQGLSMALSALPALLKHPMRVAERLLAGLSYRGDAPVALPNYWLLSSLGVSLDHAGGGVGKVLLRRFCADAEAQGAPGVYLLTDRDDNDMARRFYEAQGFCVHAEHHRRDGRQLLVMARRFI